jgi:hypothetical protein
MKVLKEVFWSRTQWQKNILDKYNWNTIPFVVKRGEEYLAQPG